jgi:DNA ligase-1
LVNFFSVANAEASALRLSESLVFSSWESLTLLRQDARWRGVEGVMLKSMDCAYGVGRTKTQGVWWKWKLDPMSVDAVLVYAQAGHGRRANLFTDYTFAVWDRQPNDDEVQQVCEAISRRETPLASQDRGLPRLVTFAKAYSGLTDAQFKQVDKIIREHAVDKFGPVRSVIPSLVFELGFEGIALSGRHKSGVAVRFPRMLRIREDKRLSQANTLADLKALLGMQP